MTTTTRVLPATAWISRTDGSGSEHARWHSTISPVADFPGVALLGFACDEGVRRNGGRPGAAAGPDAIRAALSPLPVHDDTPRYDAGMIRVTDRDLVAGQLALADTALELLDESHTLIVLGGGHEASYGSHLGLRSAVGRSTILNLDAHLGLHTSDTASSGTPFRQIAELEGEDFSYNVFGVSRPDNTRELFDTAAALGVGITTDEELAVMTPEEAARAALAAVEGHKFIHLSIDLDVLPAHIAPGVSSPAAVGVELAKIRAIARALAVTGRLRLVDIVELNPRHDINTRTARVAAQLVEEITSSL